MFGEKESKGVVIVYDRDTEEYAEYLYGLIGSKDDKNGDVVGVEDGTVHAVMLSEKAYNDTKNTITSDEYMIFIGNNKITKSIIKNMKVKYDKFGMVYGWLGKRAVLYVHTPIRNRETYDKFLEYAASYEKKFDKVSSISDVIAGLINKKKVSGNEATEAVVKTGVAGAAGAASAGAVGVVAGAGVLGGLFAPVLGTILIDKKVSENKIRKQQYTCLMLAMYMEGLKEFLED